MGLGANPLDKSVMRSVAAESGFSSSVNPFVGGDYGASSVVAHLWVSTSMRDLTRVANVFVHSEGEFIEITFGLGEFCVRANNAAAISADKP
jgi:hypothetical protein